MRNYVNLNEADRSRFINKMPNLSDAEKEKLIKLFKDYNNIGNDIKWGSKEVTNMTYKDFTPYIRQAVASTSAEKASVEYGLESLEEGVDYIYLGSYENGDAYQPLTYLGSKVLASNSVGQEIWCIAPAWSTHSEEFKNLKALTWGKCKDYDTLIKNTPIDTDTVEFPGAKWCIAMQTSDYHWNDYTQEGNRFIYYINNDESAPMKYKKIAIVIDSDDDFYEVFNTLDDNIISFGEQDATDMYTTARGVYDRYLDYLEEPDGYSKHPRDDAHLAYESIFGSDYDESNFEESYIGYFEDYEDFARDYISNTVGIRNLQKIDEFEDYFDWEAWGEALRRAFIEDADTEEDIEYWNNMYAEDIGHDYEDAIDSEVAEKYFDFDSLACHLANSDYSECDGYWFV